MFASSNGTYTFRNISTPQINQNYRKKLVNIYDMKKEEHNNSESSVKNLLNKSKSNNDIYLNPIQNKLSDDTTF